VVFRLNEDEVLQAAAQAASEPDSADPGSKKEEKSDVHESEVVDHGADKKTDPENFLEFDPDLFQGTIETIFYRIAEKTKDPAWILSEKESEKLSKTGIQAILHSIPTLHQAGPGGQFLLCALGIIIMRLGGKLTNDLKKDIYEKQQSDKTQTETAKPGGDKGSGGVRGSGENNVVALPSFPGIPRTDPNLQSNEGT